MAECGDIIEKLPLYIEGEFQGDEKQKIEAHISGCESCRLRCAEFKNMLSALKDVKDIPAAEGVHDRIMQGVKKFGENKRKSRFKEIIPAAACFIFMCIVTVVLCDVQNKKALRQAEEAENIYTARSSDAGINTYEKKAGDIIYESLTITVKSGDIAGVAEAAEFYDPEAVLNGDNIDFKILKQDLDGLMEALSKAGEAEITNRELENKTEEYNKIVEGLDSVDKEDTEAMNALAEQAFFMEMDGDCYFIKIVIENF